MKSLEQLAARWASEAELLEAHGAVQAARTCRLHAGQLVTTIREAGREILTMAEAAEFSGYSQRRLRELCAEGAIENVGRKGAPRFRRGDLPLKPGSDAGTDYDPAADARRILTLDKEAAA